MNRRSQQPGFWPIVLAAVTLGFANSGSLIAQSSQSPADSRQPASRPATPPGSTNRTPSRQRQQPASPTRFTDARPITPTGNHTNTATAGKRRTAVGGPSAWKTIGVLAGIIAVILFGSRLWKKHGPKLSGSIPAEAIDVLGKRSIDSRQAIYLIRLGSRIIVVGSTVNGLQTLSEVTDPVEVDYLAGLCKQQADEGGMGQSFRSLFSGHNVLNSASDPSAQAASELPAETDLQQPQFASRAFSASGRSDV